MGEAGPRVSVVVPTIHRPQPVARCLEALVAGDFPDFEAVVVDQSDDAATREIVARRFGGDPRIRYLHSGEKGAARARNLGVASTTGSVVVFLDDDVVPAPGLLRAHAAAFDEAGSRVGLVGGRILPEWESPCPSWFPPELGFILGLYDAGPMPREYPPGDTPPSANLAALRSALREVGGFDARLGYDAGRRNPLLAGEDVHLAQKVLAHGYAIRYEPGAEVRHHIRGYKLTPAFLVRRFYWEGRTFATLRRYARTEGRDRGLVAMWKDSRRKRRERPAGSATRRAAASRVVLAAALGALAAGALVESLVPHASGARAEPPP